MKKYKILWDYSAVVSGKPAPPPDFPIKFPKVLSFKSLKRRFKI